MSVHKEHIIKLSNSEIEYKLIIKVENNNNFIEFILHNIQNQIKERYYLKITHEELKALDKYFLLFDAIIDCANSISTIIKDCTPRLAKENKGMNLHFTLFLPGQQQREIKLFLDESQIDSLEIIDELKEENNKLKAKLNDLEISVNSKDALYKELKHNFDELKKNFELTIQQINVDIINIKSKIDKDDKAQPSTIITNNLELNLISNKLRLINGKNVEYKLLYRMSRDSGKANIFHSLCNQIRGTLIIIKTTKGHKFGGYTYETWEGNGISKKDNLTFIYSLNNNKIYDIKQNQLAIFCSPNLGPVFSGNNSPTLIINDNSEINGGECCLAQNSNYNGYIYDYEINGGEKKFQIADLEVFKVSPLSNQ